MSSFFSFVAIIIQNIILNDLIVIDYNINQSQVIQALLYSVISFSMEIIMFIVYNFYHCKINKLMPIVYILPVFFNFKLISSCKYNLCFIYFLSLLLWHWIIHTLLNSDHNKLLTCIIMHVNCKRLGILDANGILTENKWN